MELKKEINKILDFYLKFDPTHGIIGNEGVVNDIITLLQLELEVQVAINGEEFNKGRGKYIINHLIQTMETDKKS